jgi:hypothetical protein
MLPKKVDSGGGLEQGTDVEAPAPRPPRRVPSVM